MTDPTDRLRKLAELLPPGAELVLRSDDLRALADGVHTPPADQPGADLTLAEVGERVGRSVSTVRDWCNSGRIPGAYKLRGREWRIPPDALQAFLDQQERAPERAQPAKPARKSDDPGSWRDL